MSDPYRPGRTLDIYFKSESSSSAAGQHHFSIRDIEIQNELSPDWRHGFTLLKISIVQAFSPFTSAVVLLAEALDAPAQLKSLPKRFILKLCDRRFGYRDPEQPHLLWRPEIEGPLREGIRQIVGPGRSNPIPRMYYSRKFEQLQLDEDGPIPEWDGWELELFIWTAKQDSYLAEALAYRHLRALQGSCIPTLHGTVRVPMSPSAEFVHPVVDFVHGLALEYIRGLNMGQLKVGVDITKDVAELTSRRLIDRVAQIRDSYCWHNDLRLPNVILRGWPNDPQPVIIDFGLAEVIAPGESKEEWAGNVDEVMDVRKVVTDPEHGNWHVGSPFPQRIYERIAANHGYARANSRIEDIPEDVRNVQFERVPGSEAPGARERMLLRRVRPGVRTQDGYLFRQGT